MDYSIKIISIRLTNNTFIQCCSAAAIQQRAPLVISNIPVQQREPVQTESGVDEKCTLCGSSVEI